MIPRLLSIPCILLLASTSLGQQALVRSFENASLEIGQGYLTHYADACYVLLPTHVASESGTTAALLGEGAASLLGETTQFVDLGDDLTVAGVLGNLSTQCGYSAMAVSRAVGSLIESSGLATVRSVNGDGTIAQLSVTIFDDDGSAFLRIQPTHDSNQLRKGQSGSLLMAGDTPIGMLLAVDARFGVGKVIRLDTMLAKFDGHIAKALASANAASAAQALTVTSWSAMAVAAQHRAVNLVATDDTPAWIASPRQWPVIVELALGDERVAIAGVEFDGTVDDESALPGLVEIFVSSTLDGDRWRSVAGGNVTFVSRQATFQLAPTWARRVRLAFGPSSNGETIALRRVRVLLAD